MFKKNAAIVGFGIGNFVNAATGSVVTTGTPTCKRTLDGTAGSCANAAAYDATGLEWKIDLAAGDLNGDMVALSFTLTDCLPINYTIRTTTKLTSDLQDLTAAQVNAEADTALSDAALATAANLALVAARTIPYQQAASTLKVWGDSWGTGSQVTATTRYSALMANRMGLTESNSAASAKQIDDAEFGIAMLGATVTSATKSVCIFGVNDMRYTGSNLNTVQQDVADAFAGYLAHNCIPTANTLQYDNVAITYTGTWANSSTVGGLKRSTTAGDTAAFAVTGSTILIWVPMATTGWGTITIAVDGGTAKTYSLVKTQATSAGAVLQTKLIRISGLTNAAHDVVLTIGATGYGGLCAAAGLDGSLQTPEFIVGLCPRLVPGTYAQYAGWANGSDSIVEQFNARMLGVIAALKRDGLRIHVFDTSMDDTMFDADNVHPNYAGHAVLAGRALAACYDASMDLDVGWTSSRAKRIDDEITSRSIAGDAMTLTAAYDAAKTAAPASTALSTSVWTNTMAGYLDASVAGIPAAVWAVSTRTLSSFGSLVADVATAVWGAGARTLTAISDSAGVTTLLSRLSAVWSAQLDVAVSTRLADADYTAPTPGGDATAANQTLILAAIAALDLGAGSGLVEWTYEVKNNTTGAVIPSAVVKLCSDSAGTDVIYQTVSDALGIAHFFPADGVYWAITTRPGYAPGSEEVTIGA